MKLKQALFHSLLLFTLTLKSEVILTNSYYNIGTNGFDLFCTTAIGTTSDTVYGWEDSTDLVTWTYYYPPFIGFNQDKQFYVPVTHGDTSRFYRLIVIAPLEPTAPMHTYGTNRIVITNWPSLHFPPSLH